MDPTLLPSMLGFETGMDKLLHMPSYLNMPELFFFSLSPKNLDTRLLGNQKHLVYLK